MTPPTPKIALFGAAGAIGNTVARSLSAQGTPYRVVGRGRPALERDFGADPLAEIACWNPDSPASVQAAAQGIDTIIYMVGVEYTRFALHPQLMRKTLDGAIAAGVKRIVLIGTVYPYGRPQATPVREDHARAPHTFKGRMRKAQEDMLLDAHAKGLIEVAILRLPDFYGPGAGEKSFLAGAFQAALDGGTADLIGPIDLPHEFVFVPDVGPVVTALLAAPGAWGRTWHLAGAGTTTQQAMLEHMSRLTGRPVRKRVAGKTMLRLLGLFKPMLRELTEMHYLLTEPVILDDSALQSLIGPIAKTSYAKGVQRTLAASGFIPPSRSSDQGHLPRHDISHAIAVRQVRLAGFMACQAWQKPSRAASDCAESKYVGDRIAPQKNYGNQLN
jgi:nucleoside-diphosphate-sugar epimerase